MSARYIVGDVLEVLRAMPDASVDLVLSSPPFLALRSYLPADHPDKAKEIGSEPTPGAFIDTLLDVVEECRRVLAPHGSLCFELGDTYAGSGGAGGDYNTNGLREGQARFDGSASKAYGTGAAPRPARTRWRSPGADPKYAQRGEQSMGTGAAGNWPLDKSLCLIPELLRVAMVYGFNPLTGRTTPRWRARNVVRWCRPNPPVGALGDKVRPATSDIIVACVDRKRYFDLDAVRTEHKRDSSTNLRHGEGVGDETGRRYNHGKSEFTNGGNAAGAPPLDHWWVDEETFEQDAWHIPTEPYKGSHYATWPTDLLVKPILAMCPIKVCTTCGTPSERITEQSRARVVDAADAGKDRTQGRHIGGPFVKSHLVDRGESVTTGWTDCGHETWRKGVVLDPFGGSGTTAVVALGHGRDAILIDLDERNAELARDRVGMWLEVAHHVPTEVPA